MTADTNAPTDWQAQWIWGTTENNNGDPNAERYFYFRQTVAIPAGETSGSNAEVISARLRVCADSRYRLWLNGQMLGHGPARSDPASQYYDEYDVADRLKPGVNVFAALVTHYGIGTCFACLGSPGFLLQADVILAGGETVTVVTDSDWRVCPAPYATGFRRMSIQLAYPEVFDANQEPQSWNLPGFADSDWNNAAVLGPVGIKPWTTLIPRDIPLPFFRAISPQSLIQTNVVRRVPASDTEFPTPAADMARATTLEPAPKGSVTYKHPALFTVAPQPAPVSNSGPRPPTPDPSGISVVLDFGREVSGFPLIVIRRCGGGTIDIGYSESIEPDGTITPHHLVNDVRYADRLILRPGFQRWEPLDHRAFRYMRLDFYDCPEPIEILVEMTTSGYPVENRGVFQCSEPLLERIWEVGRCTTALCMDDGFMDTPWRERGQWLGDARVEALVAAYAFGDTDLARKALLQYPQSQDESGWFRGVYPSDTEFDAVLPTFCMIWPVALWDYFLLTGDRTLLEAVWPNVERLIAAMLRYIDADGLVVGLPGWVFVDWARVNVAGQSTAVNAMAYDGLKHAGKIARTMGCPERGEQWQLQAEDIADSLNDLMWDRARGLYSDGIVNARRLDSVSEQANVLAALVGIADAAQTKQILQALSAAPPVADVQIATPYFSFYYLRLLYANQRHEQALAYIRQRWSAMLDAGATAFWEQWEPHWSLCHAWSAGPTHDLMAEFAGIRPLQPGFEEFTVDVRPCWMTWIRAVVPTPRGDIALAYHYRTNVPDVDAMGTVLPLGPTTPAITVHLTVPTGTRAHVCLPLHGIESPTVRFNGKTVWQNGEPVPPSGDKFARDGDTLVFAIVGGRFAIEIERDSVGA